MTWLHKIWISPSEHDRIVEELQLRIDRLEADYVAVAHSLIEEMQARRAAERVRDHLTANAVRQVPASNGKVIPFERRGSKKSPVFVAALEEHKV